MSELGKVLVEPDPNTLVVENRTIGTCHVTFVGFEQNQRYDLYPIFNYITAADKIVLEYFLHDLQHTVLDVPLAKDIAERYLQTGIAQLSDQVARQAQAEEKNILVMDPSNSILYGVSDVFLGPTVAFIGAETIYSVVKERRKEKKEQQEPKKMDRRQVLKLIAGAAVTATGLSASSHLLQDREATEDLTLLYRDLAINTRDMRWQTVAEGLVQYCSAPENVNQDLVLFYPPAHIKPGILHYLDNPGQRRIKNTAYAHIPGLTRQIREYRPAGWSNWEALPPRRIG